MRSRVAVAALFSLCGVLACTALASGAAVSRDITAFERKNIGYFSGYIERPDDGLIDRLEDDQRIMAVWGQKPFGPVVVDMEGADVTLERKYPLPRASESVSFGAMPRHGKREIALSPSIARKLSPDLASLVGRGVRVNVGGEEFELTICGIYNAGYDDVCLSSDIEELVCDRAEGEMVALSYEVRTLNDVLDLHRELVGGGIDVVDASDAVKVSLDSFNRLRVTFLVVSGAVSLVSLVAGAALVVRDFMARGVEFGVRRVVGFTRGELRGCCRREALLVALGSSTLSCAAMAALPFLPVLGGLEPAGVQVAVAVFGGPIALMLMFESAAATIVRRPLEKLLATD